MLQKLTLEHCVIIYLIRNAIMEMALSMCRVAVIPHTPNTSRRCESRQVSSYRSHYSKISLYLSIFSRHNLYFLTSISIFHYTYPALPMSVHQNLQAIESTGQNYRGRQPVGAKKYLCVMMPY